MHCETKRRSEDDCIVLRRVPLTCIICLMRFVFVLGMHRKLAKSTLVLIPLFGVYYMFFIVINAHNTANPTLEVVLFYLEMTLNSFQVWSL